MNTLVLASNSKARYKLLKDAGYNVIVQSTNIEEKSNKISPHEIVMDLAKQKLNAYIEKYGKKQNKIILSADTMILYKNQLIGKANNKNEAYNILKKLSNDSHEIFSAFAIHLPNEQIIVDYDKVDIKFKNLSDLSIMDYLESDEWKGAAGAYRIQDKAKDFIKEINGDFNVAVGLPLNKISDLIE